MSPRFSRLALGALLTLALVACSDDDPTGGLLNSGGAGADADDDALVVITLDGPDCVTSGQRSDLFTATVTEEGSGDPVADVFVGVEGQAGDEPAGLVRGIDPDGGTTLGGANTNANGIMRFRYTAPDGLRRSIGVALTAQVLDSDDNPRGEGETAIEVAPAGTPVVELDGPLIPGTSNRAPSGTLELEPGDLATNLLVTISARDACDGGVEPLSGATFSLEASPMRGTIRQTETTTALDGTAVFDYSAPATSTARQTITITALSSTGAGNEGFANYALDVLPDPPAPFLRLTLDGPTSVAAGGSQDGYIVSVEQVQLDNAGNETVTAGEDIGIALSSSDNGDFEVTPNANGLEVTDAFGQMQFSFEPAASGTTAQTVQLSAAVDTATTSDGATLCAGSNARCEDTINVRVQADTFTFTAPVFGESGLVGGNNAVPLSINWRDGTGAGVTGCVNLSTTFSGSGGTAFGLVLNDDTVNTRQQRTNVRVVNGSFAQSHALFSDRSGFVEVTAVDNRNCTTNPASALEANTGVQFQDVVCDGTDAEDCVDLRAPLRVLQSPDESGNQRTAELTMEVRNDAFQPIDGAQVTFELVAPASAGDPNERVFPGGGTTNANGIANSTYFVPNLGLTAGQVRTVDIEACVRGVAASGAQDGRVCRTRRIEIAGPPAP